MPTYVYKFIDTGETIEVQQGFTDPTLTETEHPSTGAKMRVKKVFQPVGVTFKGGGFYKTDSRSGSSRSSSSSNGDAKTSSNGSTTESSSSSTTSSSDSSSSTPAPTSTPASSSSSSTSTSSD